MVSFHQYNFEGRYDLVRFIKEIQAQGLYVSLRIGPFIESEWKYGYEWNKYNKAYILAELKYFREASQKRLKELYNI